MNSILDAPLLAQQSDYPDRLGECFSSEGAAGLFVHFFAAQMGGISAETHSCLVSRVANAENNRTEPRRLGPLSGGLGRNWNEHWMRFISHKTTDQILDNLTGYLNRISNSGH